MEGGLITTPRHQTINVATLPPILRTLLVTDGTVTKVLEAFFWEPVNVEGVQQQLETATTPRDDLAIGAGETYLFREVQLRGEKSGDVYVYAHSIIRVQQLPPDLINELIAGRIGIGQLLRTKGLETFREIIDVFTENMDNGTQYIGRTYRIYLHDVPAITVTEKFPLPLFEQKR
jgi:chorismate-pyruvate lyase